jgi:hypothetical protein
MISMLGRNSPKKRQKRKEEKEKDYLEYERQNGFSCMFDVIRGVLGGRPPSPNVIFERL